MAQKMDTKSFLKLLVSRRNIFLSLDMSWGVADESKIKYAANQHKVLIQCDLEDVSILYKTAR